MLNQRGMATMEMVPILMLFAMLVSFALGFFGIIHSGIVNSIAARNYAFETFRNRANLNYLRDEVGDPVYFLVTGYRYHSITGDQKSASSQLQWVATTRPIQFTEVANPLEAIGSPADHNSKVRSLVDGAPTSDKFEGQTRAAGDAGVDPVWVMTSYGICLTAGCVPLN